MKVILLDATSYDGTERIRERHIVHPYHSLMDGKLYVDGRKVNSWQLCGGGETDVERHLWNYTNDLEADGYTVSVRTVYSSPREF